MRKSRFTDEQMVRIIREAERGSIGEVAKRHGVSEQTIYSWRKRFGELRLEDVRRLRQLEAENAPLKTLVAERDGGVCFFRCRPSVIQPLLDASTSYLG